MLPYNPVKRLSAIRAWYSDERRRSLLKEQQVKAWWEGLGSLAADLSYAHGLEIADWRGTPPSFKP